MSHDITESTLLKGRVKLLQPKEGFRAAIDAVFLAAAVPVKDKASVLDIGCGVGSAGLCLLARHKNLSLTGIDIQQDLITLANQNALLNEVQNQCRFFHGNIVSDTNIPDNSFDIVITNPPYQEGGTHVVSNVENKALSRTESASGIDLEHWIKYAHRKLKQGGKFVIVHRADRLGDIMQHLTKRKWFGSIEIIPLWPHTGKPAKRVIIRAKKERYASMILMSGITIHNTDGSYTEEAKKILENAGGIDKDKP